jgi:hypothetical protein
LPRVEKFAGSTGGDRPGPGNFFPRSLFQRPDSVSAMACSNWLGMSPIRSIGAIAFAQICE